MMEIQNKFFIGDEVQDTVYSFNEKLFTVKGIIKGIKVEIFLQKDFKKKQEIFYFVEGKWYEEEKLKLVK